LHITTFNIHKGFSQFNRRMMVHELRERLRQPQPGYRFYRRCRVCTWAMPRAMTTGRPGHSTSFLAEDVWAASAYGCNMVYDHGHHGNAILSRFPILHSHNQDVTHLQFEKRGLLHCRIELPEGPAAHCVCVHLSLFRLFPPQANDRPGRPH
jgi:endonuclease/exonuclease/phosphatase family metal-dependent hydrolase